MLKIALRHPSRSPFMASEDSDGQRLILADSIDYDCLGRQLGGEGPVVLIRQPGRDIFLRPCAGRYYCGGKFYEQLVVTPVEGYADAEGSTGLSAEDAKLPAGWAGVTCLEVGRRCLQWSFSRDPAHQTEVLDMWEREIDNIEAALVCEFMHIDDVEGWSVSKHGAELRAKNGDVLDFRLLSSGWATADSSAFALAVQILFIATCRFFIPHCHVAAGPDMTGGLLHEIVRSVSVDNAEMVLRAADNPLVL